MAHRGGYPFCYFGCVCGPPRVAHETLFFSFREIKNLSYYKVINFAFAVYKQSVHEKVTKALKFTHKKMNLSESTKANYLKSRFWLCNIKINDCERILKTLGEYLLKYNLIMSKRKIRIKSAREKNLLKKS